MAAKKFAIPSLNEMESTKRQEYKVKTLFDKHLTEKTSPEKNKESSANTTKVHGPSVAKATGPQTSVAKVTGPRIPPAGNSSFPKTDGKLSGSDASPVKKIIVPVTSTDKPSADVSATDKSAPKMIVKCSASLTAGNNSATGVSPNRPSKTSSLIVSSRQRGNPLLKHIRSVPWEFSDIVADYEMGTVMCALFLSLRYHNLNPNYIHERLKLLGHSYDLRVLLVQVDTKDPHHSLRELAKICILADCTLLCAWSPEEAARYIETYKVFENKPPDMIMEKQEVDFVSRAQEVLTSGRKINRTDVVTLLSTFGSFENIVRAGEEEMSFCPGLGIHKAKRLNTLLHEPFLRAKKRKKVEELGSGDTGGKT